MQRRISTIIATVALIVAVLGSTPLGRAAGNLVLARNSVGTPQLKNNAVIGSKVKDGSLSAADFRAGSLPAGPKGDPGAPGAPGPKGDKGDKGDTGAPGTSGYTVVSGPLITLAAGQTGGATASCPAGKHVFGGAYVVDNWDVLIAEVSPSQNNEGWVVIARNTGPAAHQFKAIAICASVS